MRKGNKMETVILGIVLMFAVCYSDEELNITYIKAKMSWNNATSYCFDNGGILESNETIVHKYSVNMTNEDVWMGSYRVLTDWAGIWGCYTLDLTSTKVTPVSLLDHLECQRRCPTTDYEFFSVKDSTCYCLKNTSLKSQVSFMNCGCSNCGDMYFVIFRQNIKSDRVGESIRKSEVGFCMAPQCSEVGFCMAAQCTDKSIKLSNEKCNTVYAVVCEDHENQMPTVNRGYVAAIKVCEERKSYIKWYSNADCSGGGNTNEHWTSITREDEMFSLTIYDKGIHISPLKCRISQVTNGNRQLEMTGCDELHSFFCRFGISTDQFVPPENNSKEENSDNTAKEENSDNTGTIAGVVIAVIAILIISVVLTAIIYKRRKKSRIPAVTKGNYDPSSRVNESAKDNRESTLYTEITDTHNGLAYSPPESLNSEKYPFPTSENSNTRAHGGHLQTGYNITDKHGSSENRGGKFHNTYNNTIHNIPEHNQMNDAVKDNEDMHEDQSCTYSVAQRIDEDDEPDPYTTNMDYDHLSNVSKKEDKNTNHKVYDHLHVESGGCDPTYDYSNANGYISTESNYDHFNPTDPDLS